MRAPELVDGLARPSDEAGPSDGATPTDGAAPTDGRPRDAGSVGPVGRDVATPGDALLRWWARIERLPTWCFLAWVAALLIARSGVSWSGFDELLRFGREFPRPGTTFRSNAVLGPAFSWLTRADSPTRWLVLHGVVTAAWFAAVVVLLRRAVGSARQWRVAVVWLSFVSSTTSLLRHLGAYDVFTLWGAALVALGGATWTSIVGGALMGATNAEQGLLALCCGALVHWALPRVDGPGDTSARSRVDERSTLAVIGPALGGLVVARLVVLVWFGQLGAEVQGRSQAFGELLRDALTNASSLGGTGAYSWLGAGWVLVLVTLWYLRHHPFRWVAVACGVVLVPAAATVTTLDGSRVFCAVSAVALLVLLVRVVPRVEHPDGSWMLRGAAALMLVGLLVPAINTTYRGGIRIPWRFFLG